MSRFGFGGLKHDWRKSGSFMRAVAKWLVGGQTTSAKCIFFAGFQVNLLRAPLGDIWKIHVIRLVITHPNRERSRSTSTDRISPAVEN
jgi:hypothetical protein